MDMLDMDKYEERIKKYAVRLDDSIEVGSGFLFAPQESNFVYIFTALHVVINTLTRIGTDLIIKWNEDCFVCKKTDREYCTLYLELEDEYLAQKTDDEIKKVVNIIDKQLRSNQNQERNRDIAALRIPKNKFKDSGLFEKKVYCIEDEKLPQDFKFLGFGYPNAKDFVLRLKGQSIKWNKVKKLRECQAVDMDQDFVNKMKGFSGTGLVTDYYGRMILTGVAISCDSEEKHQCFRSAGMSEILSKMKERGWELPDLYGEGVPPKNFLEKVSYFRDDLEFMEPSVKNGLVEAFLEIEQKNKPDKLAEIEVFYDIPECTGERIACPVYWKGRFWVLYVYRAIHDLVEANDNINLNGQELRIEYICTEGNGKADISTVVVSAIRKSILGNQIKGNCILVWQSEESPNRRIFPTRKFKNIVRSIAEGTAYGMNGKPEKAGYDLLAGEMKTKNYGIFHIKYLIEQLEQCQTMDDVDNKVREVLEDVWK